MWCPPTLRRASSEVLSLLLKWLLIVRSMTWIMEWPFHLYNLAPGQVVGDVLTDAIACICDTKQCLLLPNINFEWSERWGAPSKTSLAPSTTAPQMPIDNDAESGMFGEWCCSVLSVVGGWTQQHDLWVYRMYRSGRKFKLRNFCRN